MLVWCMHPEVSGSVAYRHWCLPDSHLFMNLITQHASSPSIAISVGLCNTWYSCETHPKLKSWEKKVAHNVHFLPIVFEFCTRHDSITAILCTKFWIDWIWGNVLWPKEISRDLCLRWGVDEYPTLQISLVSRKVITGDRGLQLYSKKHDLPYNNMPCN